MFSPIKVVMKTDLGSVKSKLSSLDGENFSGDVLHLLSGRRETSNVLIISKKSSYSKGGAFGNCTAVLHVSHTFDPLVSHLLLEGISRVITMRYCKMFSNHQQLVSLICACMPSTLEIALLRVCAVQPSSLVYRL